MSAAPTGGLANAVAERMRSAITSGELAAGSKLPPEPALADELSVSRATLRDALRILERERLITRRQRAGTWVSRRREVWHPLQRNTGVADLIASSGKRHGIEDAQIRFTVATDEAASALGLEPDAGVAILERTRTADGQPIVRTVDHLDAKIVAAAKAALLPEVSLYGWLYEHCGIAVCYGVARVRAMLATREIARSLSIRAGEPVLTLVQTDYTRGGEPVLFSVEYHVVDAFDATIVRDGPY